MKHKLLTGSLSFTVGMGFSALPAVAQQSPASTEVKPNVIIINVDDLGYGDIGCYGATKVKTPNIDRLASQGRSFTDAHSSSAVSTPSRYGLMTGQYPCREDIWGAIFLNQTLQIDTARTTIADVMKTFRLFHCHRGEVASWIPYGRKDGLEQGTGSRTT